MSHRRVVGLLVTSVVCGMCSAGWAADPASSSAPSSTAAAQVAETIKGRITSLDLQSSTPSVQVTLADGTVSTLALDQKNTTVWQDGKAALLSQLTLGQRVKIRHELKGGKDAASSISIARVGMNSPVAPTAAVSQPAPTASAPASAAPAGTATSHAGSTTGAQPSSPKN